MLVLVSSPVLVPLCPLKYVVDIAVPCQVPVPIVPKVVMLVLPANVDIAVFSTLFKDKSVLVSDAFLPSIVFASVNLAKSLSTGVPLVSTVPVFVVKPVELNAFEPNSLVPTTPLPLIINEVASEFCADNPLSVSVAEVSLLVKLIEPVVIESVVTMCSIESEPSFFLKNTLPSYVLMANSPKATSLVPGTLCCVDERFNFNVCAMLN